MCNECDECDTDCEEEDNIDPNWHSMELRYSRPWEQIGIVWTYGTLEDLSASLDKPIPEVLLKNPRIQRMEWKKDEDPEVPYCGGSILLHYDGEKIEEEENVDIIKG